MEKYSAPYTKFAAAYDKIMHNVDYVKWVNYIRSLFMHYRCEPHRILELACGTGTVMVQLAKYGYEMWGLDRAAEMLESAQKKADKTGQKIELFQGDMRDFSFDEKFDAVLCLYDSINYILEKDEMAQVFENVYNVLEPNGLFIFDVTTERNIVQHFHLQTFAENEDDFSYIWKNVYSYRDRICRTVLTFFLRENDDSFKRYEELHLQKIFEVNEIEDLLEKTGYKLLSAFDAFSMRKWNKDSDRINFTARKIDNCKREKQDAEDVLPA